MLIFVAAIDYENIRISRFTIIMHIIKHCHHTAESSQHSGDIIASNIADTALPKEASGAKKTIVSPQYLPSGPLINLTKVAAQHKKNQMSYTSLVAKHAAMEMKKATPKAPPTTEKKATPTSAPPTSRQPAKPTYSIIRRREIELTGMIDTFNFT